ncbi:MAG TPA: DUF192 domain-containing protein [Acidimicrobiia bacterium]|nr:DUF192 domain-containing protein [Acidimicrobiia bacterium]
MSWLVRDGDVLAAAEVADTGRARRNGLLGRDSFDGALVLRPCRNVHTARMRFAIDVAFCDPEGVVLRTVSLPPWRLSPYVRKAAFAIEAQAGAFDRWQLRTGDRVELRA